MAKQYKAYKLITDMAPTTYVHIALIEYHKKMFDFLTTNFGGFKQIGQWDYTTKPTSDPTVFNHFLTGYFNLDNGNDKQIMLFDMNVEDASEYHEDTDPVWWSDEIAIGPCLSNHSQYDVRPEGINTISKPIDYPTRAQGQWSIYGIEHWMMAYTDENDTLIGFSNFQKDYSYSNEYMYGAVMFFDRQKGKIYTTFSTPQSAVISTNRDTWIAPYRGEDLMPQGKFAFSGKTQADPYAIYEPAIVKDIVDNFSMYDGDVEVIELGCYDLLDRRNQRITIGEQQYIHLGYGKLYLPISEYHELTIRLN